MHYVIGDIHGCLSELELLLRRTKFIDDKNRWIAKEHQLHFLGDYTDRGPDGIGVIDLIMQLQVEAADVGGKADCLLGNHDVLLLSACRFPDEDVPSFSKEGVAMSFYGIWRKNGGLDSDLERIETRHLEWLANLPALRVVNNSLLMHSDNTHYFQLGDTVESINEVIRKVIWSDSLEGQDLLSSVMTDRLHFASGGISLCKEICDRFEVQRLIHGHTPIFGLLDMEAPAVTQPLEYNEGMCVNMDHALFKGGPGFVLELPENN